MELTNLNKIIEKIEEIKIKEMESINKGTGAACRRARVSLSEVAKLCKEARKELLTIMKS